MSQLHRRTDLVLHPAAQILLRGDGAVQFGLDASRAGILTTCHARELARVLSRLRRPCPEAAVRTRLRTAGFSTTDIDGVLEELLAYGILRRHRAHGVVVIGRSPLAAATVRMLRDTGFTVHRCASDADEEAVLTNSADERLLMIIDRPALPPEEALWLVENRERSLPVSLLDGRGFLGPARLRGAGPCPVCVQLHWVGHDDYFHRVTARLTDPEQTAALRQDPVAVAATAAAAAALAARLVGMAYGPQTVLPAPQAGLSLVVDPYDPDQGHRFTLGRHAGCPVCFEAESRREHARTAARDTRRAA